MHLNKVRDMKDTYKNLFALSLLLTQSIGSASNVHSSLECKVLEQTITFIDNGKVFKNTSYNGYPENGEKIIWMFSLEDKSYPALSIKVLTEKDKETIFHYLYPLQSGEKFSFKHESVSNGYGIRLLNISDMYAKTLTIHDSSINGKANAAGSFNFHLKHFLNGDWGGMITTPPQPVNYSNVIESWNLNFRCTQQIGATDELKDEILKSLNL